jgi:hypothetical protein
MQELWVDYRHPEYDEEKRKRKFSRDQYSGEALEVVLNEAKKMAHERAVVSAIDGDDGESPGVRVYDSLGANKYGTYLKRRSQGEMGAAFAERAAITRFPSHYAALVDSMIGGVFAVEGKAHREFDGPLGSPEDPMDPMYHFLRDVDGTGVNMESWLISAGQRMVVDNWFWYRVDRVGPDDPIRAYWVDPDTILNWREEGGVLVEVLQKEMRYEQESLMEKGVWVKYYRRWTLDGWELYREYEEDGDRQVVLVADQQFAFPFYTDSSRTRRRLPFGRTRLPLDRYVGYQMAQDHNMLYNLLSDARWNFRVINHPRLTGDVEDSQWTRSLNAIMEGVNAMQGDWRYISPDANNGHTAYKVYSEETRQFYISNHQRMNAASIERSATEVLFDEASGRTAFLRIYASAIDEVENDLYFLAAQWESPESPSSWYGTYVKRSSDFKPVDVQGLIKTQADAFAAVANHLDVPSALQFAREGAVDGLKEKERQDPPPMLTPPRLGGEDPQEEGVQEGAS